MLYPINNRADLEKLEELASLDNQLRKIRVQDKLGKQNVHDDMKKFFEPVSDTLENTSEDLTKTTMLTSKENDKALANIKDKHLELMNYRGIQASYLLSPLSIITKSEQFSQYKLVKDPHSNRVIDL